ETASDTTYGSRPPGREPYRCPDGRAGSAGPHEPERVGPLGLHAVLHAGPGAVLLDDALARPLLAADDLLLPALEPVVGLLDVAGAERGVVDLGGDQLADELLVRLEGHRLGDAVGEHLGGVAPVVAAHEVAGDAQVLELHVEVELPDPLDL